MGLLYLTCLIAGGAFILLTLVGGADTDVEMDFDGDIADGIDVDSADAGTDGDGLGELARLLSFRNVVFFVGAFGLTGTLLGAIGTNSILTFILSVAVGAFAAVLMHKSMSYLMENEVGEAVQTDDLIGYTAKVVIGMSGDQKGKISLQSDGRHLQMLALTADESEKKDFRSGDSVLIVRVEDNTAFVADADFV